ncbi:DDE Tnp4 domain-containing protein [Aphis craccivora]|uniref:DDE Tnp4 domain-containing protein n=1 Tax=Aphis craccivora TaxID=307492 RepID=A0A6G0Y1L3_APHCR|nr:DDE Tnp4 domain-containing protein [Aphis craccivora]
MIIYKILINYEKLCIKFSKQLIRNILDSTNINIWKSGTLFFNYKDFVSIVLLAIVDANCKFIFVDIGSYGKEGDSVFPPNANIPNSDQILPYVIVGDGAFRLDPHMMRPCSKIESRNDCEKK